MSMPSFPQIDPPLTREGSLNEIIASIAAEELSLSHILNAEGEKLQYVLGTLPGLDEAAAFEEVMRVNQSVQNTLADIMEQQTLLTEKLSAALRAPVLPGPAGPVGPAGATGPAEGPTGPVGPTGPTGADGPAGAAGPAGPTGAAGAAGAQGPAGPTGADGAVGPAGAMGSAGAAGATGPTGPRGRTARREQPGSRVRPVLSAPPVPLGLPDRPGPRDRVSSPPLPPTPREAASRCRRMGLSSPCPTPRLCPPVLRPTLGTPCSLCLSPASIRFLTM